MSGPNFISNVFANNIGSDVKTVYSGPGSIGYAPVDYASGASEDAIAFNGSTSGSTIGANSVGSVITQFTTLPVPEPMTASLTIGAMGLLARRRRV